MEAMRFQDFDCKAALRNVVYQNNLRLARAAGRPELILNTSSTVALPMTTSADLAAEYYVLGKTQNGGPKVYYDAVVNAYRQYAAISEISPTPCVRIGPRRQAFPKHYIIYRDGEPRYLVRRNAGSTDFTVARTVDEVRTNLPADVLQDPAQTRGMEVEVPVSDEEPALPEPYVSISPVIQRPLLAAGTKRERSSQGEQAAARVRVIDRECDRIVAERDRCRTDLLQANDAKTNVENQLAAARQQINAMQATEQQAEGAATSLTLDINEINDELKALIDKLESV